MGQAQLTKRTETPHFSVTSKYPLLKGYEAGEETKGRRFFVCLNCVLLDFYFYGFVEGF